MKALVIDFSRVLIFPKQDGVESLNNHHLALSQQPDYRLLDHFYLNQELLSYLAKLKPVVPVYVFTDGALHELPELAGDLKDIFKQMHTVDSLGVSKKDPEAYIVLADKLGYAPQDLMFIDDKSANVGAANTAGLQAVQYQSNSQIITALDAAFRKL
jgi:HAD superfamily hydrolase (TIGR01509 family)